MRTKKFDTLFERLLEAVMTKSPTNDDNSNDDVDFLNVVTNLIRVLTPTGFFSDLEIDGRKVGVYDSQEVCDHYVEKFQEGDKKDLIRLTSQFADSNLVVVVRVHRNIEDGDLSESGFSEIAVSANGKTKKFSGKAHLESVFEEVVTYIDQLKEEQEKQEEEEKAEELDSLDTDAVEEVPSSEESALPGVAPEEGGAAEEAPGAPAKLTDRAANI
jgi:hypothetical protein